MEKHRGGNVSSFNLNLALLLQLVFWTANVIDMVATQTSSPVSPAAKEHKVHNIMLYPEKHSWCKPESIKQVVTHPGCRSIDMENNICVGSCFSFSVPRTIPETPGDDQLYYCDSCQPNVVSWTTVLLECPNTPTREPVSKMVEIISNCSCNTFRNIEMYENQISSDGDNDDDDHDDLNGPDEEEEDEDNSLPEINAFISRHGHLKIKSLPTAPLTVDRVVPSESITNKAETKKPAQVIPSRSNVTSAEGRSESPTQLDNDLSSNGTTSSTDLLSPKFLHSDQLLQFQELSAEEDETELEEEEPTSEH